MRKAAIVIIAAVLAACGQANTPGASSGETASSAAAAVFPDLFSAAYRAEATLTDDSGRTTPLVMIRSGRKLRMEMTTPEGAQTIIFNPDSNESIIIANAAGRRMAVKVDHEQVPDVAQDWGEEVRGAAVLVGPCSGAGESGSAWSHTPEGAAGPNVACLTSDGIILSASENGRPTWETTSVQRGPQDAALFQVPPGVQVMDLGAMLGPGAAQALERMRQGQ